MQKPRYSPEERQRILHEVEAKRLQEEESDRIFNQTYRKSFVFIAAWAIRLIYVILLVLVLIFNDRSNGLKNEIVVDKNVENYTYASIRGTFHIKDYHIFTNIREYTIDIRDQGIPEINVGDTVLIERNIFGRAIYITKSDWAWAYGIANGMSPIPYCIVLMLTLFSFFLNDGTARFTNKLLLLVVAADIIAIMAYFLS